MSEQWGVSIIVVNYNNEGFLAVTIGSALGQEYLRAIGEADPLSQVAAAAPAILGHPDCRVQRTTRFWGRTPTK